MSGCGCVSVRRTQQPGLEILRYSKYEIQIRRRPSAAGSAASLELTNFPRMPRIYKCCSRSEEGRGPDRGGPGQDSRIIYVTLSIRTMYEGPTGISLRKEPRQGSFHIL